LETINQNPEKESKSKVKGLIKKIKPRQMIYPIVIGFGFASWMLYSQLNGQEIPFSSLTFSALTPVWLLVAALFMFSRDIGYMIRLRILAGNEITWRQTFRVIMLWEFTSAVTPSVVGGTSLAVLFIHKENISVGRSSAIVMATAFLDEMYFALMFPLVLILISSTELFATQSGGDIANMDIGNSLFYLAVLGYSLKFIYFLFIAYGLFINPQFIKKVIVLFFKLPLLRRKKDSAEKAGDEIISSSKVLKGKPLIFWLKAFLATFLSWTSRYWVVNAMFLAFFVFEKSHFLLFARQLVMWIMMLVSPTPGGSGFSEAVFTEYLGDFLPTTAGIAVIMAVIWRIFTYYPYLFVGAIVVPKWIKDKFSD